MMATVLAKKCTTTTLCTNSFVVSVCFLQYGIRDFAKKRSDLAFVALYIESPYRSACSTFQPPFFGVSFWLSIPRRSLTSTNRVLIIVAKTSRRKFHCPLRFEIIKTRVTTHYCCHYPSLMVWLCLSTSSTSLLQSSPSWYCSLFASQHCNL